MKFPQAYHTQAAYVVPPKITNDHLAMKLQQNWMAKHPIVEHLANGGKDTLDDSLTSLNWLHNLNMNIGNPTPPVSPIPYIHDLKESTKVNPNQVLGINLGQPSMNGVSLSPIDVVSMDRIDYKTNPYVKPPYSYATLICMAMKAYKRSKITLSAIYRWITENFMYYRLAEPSWQNSVRHNLSLNKCFQKVPRQKDEPGKGGFWRINPDYNDILNTGVFKKRVRNSVSGEQIAGVKRDSDEKSSSSSPSKKRSKKPTMDETAEACLAINDDSQLDSLLSQDINVDGMKLRTRDIIDSYSDSTSPLVSLSPSPSENTSDDFDLLSANLAELSEFTDVDKSANFNLSIQGVKIEPPEWWSDSLTGIGLHELLNLGNIHNQSDASSRETHPWSTDKTDIDGAMATLDDMDKLFSLPHPLP